MFIFPRLRPLLGSLRVSCRKRNQIGEGKKIEDRVVCRRTRLDHTHQASLRIPCSKVFQDIVDQVRVSLSLFFFFVNGERKTFLFAVSIDRLLFVQRKQFRRFRSSASVKLDNSRNCSFLSHLVRELDSLRDVFFFLTHFLSILFVIFF